MAVPCKLLMILIATLLILLKPLQISSRLIPLIHINPPRAVHNNLNLSTITVEGIVSVLGTLPVNKAVGHNNIHTAILKYNKHVTESRCCPNILKVAKVDPVYKSGAQNDPSSYRSI